MSLTEEKARKKWCPYAMYTAKDSYAVGNRDFLGPALNCVASECMAWRWVNAPGPRPHDAPEEIFSGFCGLAGKP